jgi:hypothetical protein
MIRLQRLGIRVRAITDEKEPGGKAGSWKALIEQAIAGAGARATEIIQYTRQGNKKTLRIKTAAGYWCEGYLKVLLHYVDGQPDIGSFPQWQETMYEMLTIGKAAFDDRSDALADIWHEEIWSKPVLGGTSKEEGTYVVQPGDDALKNFTKLSITDIRQLYDDQNPNLSPVGDWDEGYMPNRY